jgi:hypothetical protein
MAIRLLDSIVTPFLFGLGPYVLIYTLSTYPTYKAWLNTYPGSIISSGFCIIILAVGYYLVGNDPVRSEAENTQWANRLPSYLLPVITQTTTTPSSSIDLARHEGAVSKPYIGVDIDALEAGELDLPDRLLRYGVWRWTSIMGVRSCDYVSPGNEGLRVKLERLLEPEGIRKEEMGKIWLLTRPRVRGMRVDNPVSLWYVYDPLGALKVVILERHQKPNQM